MRFKIKEDECRCSNLYFRYVIDTQTNKEYDIDEFVELMNGYILAVDKEYEGNKTAKQQGDFLLYADTCDWKGKTK